MEYILPFALRHQEHFTSTFDILLCSPPSSCNLLSPNMRLSAWLCAAIALVTACAIGAVRWLVLPAAAGGPSPQLRHLLLVQCGVLTTVSLLSVYLHRRLITACELPHSLAVKCTLAFAAFVLCGAAGPIANVWMAGPRPSPLATMLLIASGAFIFLLFSVALADLYLIASNRMLAGCRVAATHPAATDAGANPSAVVSSSSTTAARYFRWRSVAILALVLAATVAAVVSAAREPALQRVSISLRKLPASLDGFRVLQLSDIHCSATIGVEFVDRVVSRALAVGADAVVITGDLADGTVAQVRASLQPLRRLAESTKHGVFFVTGNHDYYHGDPRTLFATLRELGVRVLHNRRWALPQRDQPALYLGGVDDWTAHRFATGKRVSGTDGGDGDSDGDHGADLGAVLRGRDETRPFVLLAHNPNHIHQAAAAGVDLVLSGRFFTFEILIFFLLPLVQGYLHSIDHRRSHTWRPIMALSLPDGAGESLYCRSPRARARVERRRFIARIIDIYLCVARYAFQSLVSLLIFTRMLRSISA
jgi:predicted MPP superfamily phosphohydrolase